MLDCTWDHRIKNMATKNCCEALYVVFIYSNPNIEDRNEAPGTQTGSNFIAGALGV